jgi:predicted  nucleic acid-binding Zn-ribbon protein
MYNRAALSPEEPRWQGPQSRVAQVEEKLKEHDSIILELRASAAEFKEFRGEIRESFRDVRTDMRDLRSEMRETREQVDRRFERMDQKIDRHFMWTVALMATTLVAIVGSYYR